MNEKKINLWLVLFWFVLIFLAFLFHTNNFLNGDEGVVLNGAWNLYNQRRLYFDFFSFLPPLSFYFIYWLWLFLGASFWSAKIFSIVLLLIGAVGLFKIAQHLSSRLINYFVPFIFILISSWWWIINHNFYYLVFSIWSVYFLLLFLEKNKSSYLLISALFSSAGIAILQHKGLLFVFTSFFVILFFYKEKIKNYRYLLSFSYLLFVFVPLFLLLFFWPPSLLWENLIIFPLFNYIEINRIPYYLSILSLISWLFFLWPFHFYDYKRLILLIFSGVAIISCYPLPDYYHLSMSLIFLLPILPDLFDKLSNFKKKYFKIIAVIILAWIWFWPVSYFLVFSFFKFNFIKYYSFLDYIRRECPGKYLQVGPFLPNVYLETGKLSATSFDILITGHQTEEQFNQAVLQLKINKPSCAVVAKPKSLLRFHHQFNNPVDNFIRENYQLVFVDNFITVWKLKNE